VLDLGFGADYRPAGTALRILMLAALPSAAVFVLAQTMAVVDPVRFAAFLGLSLVANIALNVALIPAHGYVAAAWTTLGCQVLLGGGWWWSLDRASRARRDAVGSAGRDEVAVPERLQAARV
jgi:O-antigen/teichoic acid export membrane protein